MKRAEILSLQEQLHSAHHRIAELEAQMLQAAQQDLPWSYVGPKIFDSFITIDAAQKIRAFNGGAELLFGYSATEAVGQPLDLLLPEASVGIHHDHVREFIASAENSRQMGHGMARIQGRRKDGSLVALEARIVAYGQLQQTSSAAVFLSDISQQEQTRLALQQAQSMLQTALSNIHEAFYLVDLRQNQLVFANPVYTQWFGEEALQQQNRTAFLKRVHPAYRRAVEDALQRQAQGLFTSVEYKLVCEEGREIWIFDRAFPSWDAQGMPTSIAGFARDITAEHEALQKLTQSERRLRQLSETLEQKVRERTAEVENLYNLAPCGYHSLDPLGRIIHINDTELEWLGYTREELLGQPVHKILSSKGHVTFRNNFSHFLQTGQLQDLEIEFCRKNGTTFAALLNASAVFDQEGNFVYSRSTIINISHLRELQVQNDFLFEQSPDALAVLNLDGVLLRVNLAFEKITQQPANALIGKTILEVGFDQPTAKVNIPLLAEQLLKGSLPYQDYPFEVTRPDGSQYYVESRFFALAMDGQPRILVTSRDVSTHIAAEEKLRRANQEIEQVMRMKDEFLASMSHELRTPLTGILGLSESLQEQVYGPINQKQNTVIGHIESSGRHLLELINDILDVSKLESGKLELNIQPCVLGQVCQASLALVKGMAQKKNLSVAFSMDQPNILLQADVLRLKQILVNLLSNAVKFTPENGDIGLEVRSNPEYQFIELIVWDTGVGIRPEDMGKLFQPFVQLDSDLNRQYNGTGLGLTLVNRLVDLHGGSVQVSSTVDKGSRFTVTLPWAPIGQTANPVVSYSRPDAHGIAPVLTDRRDVFELLHCLQETGFSAQPCYQTVRVMDWDDHEQPDGILLDASWFFTASTETLDVIKQFGKTRGVPLIIFSSSKDISKSILAGGDASLVLPSSPTQLTGILSSVGLKLDAEAKLMVISPHLVQSNLLLVDDDKTNVQTITDYLSSKYFSLHAVNSGQEFLAQLPIIRPDVILMDIQMPGMDGLEAIRRLRAHPDPDLASTPVVAITALAMSGDRQRILAVGADEYLSKPLQLQQLVTIIEKYGIHYGS